MSPEQYAELRRLFRDEVRVRAELQRLRARQSEVLAEALSDEETFGRLAWRFARDLGYDASCQEDRRRVRDLLKKRAQRAGLRRDGRPHERR